MKKYQIILITLIIVFSTAVTAMGELKLRYIMNGLNSAMKSIVESINLEDFKVIEENALLIADHERPPMPERSKIMGFLKDESAEFRGIDERVHSTANELAEAAKSRDIEGVVKGFSAVQKACVSCHQRFKSRIVDHFYSGVEPR